MLLAASTAAVSWAGQALEKVSWASVAAPCLEESKARMDGALGSLVWWKVCLPWQGCWNEISFRVPSSPNYFVILWVCGAFLQGFSVSTGESSRQELPRSCRTCSACCSQICSFLAAFFCRDSGLAEEAMLWEQATSLTLNKGFCLSTAISSRNVRQQCDLS